jgi:hypothetical protein
MPACPIGIMIKRHHTKSTTFNLASLSPSMGFVAQIVFRDSYRESGVIALSHEQLDTYRV